MTWGTEARHETLHACYGVVDDLDTLPKPPLLLLIVKFIEYAILPCHEYTSIVHADNGAHLDLNRN